RRGEPADDETVVIFSGHRVDHGDDGEDLVVPSEVVMTMTWSEFKTRFRSSESFEDTVRRTCRECGIDSATADMIEQYDLNDVANRVAAIRDMTAFCVARNAEWNEETDAECLQFVPCSRRAGASARRKPERGCNDRISPRDWRRA